MAKVTEIVDGSFELKLSHAEFVLVTAALGDTLDSKLIAEADDYQEAEITAALKEASSADLWLVFSEMVPGWDWDSLIDGALQ